MRKLLILFIFLISIVLVQAQNVAINNTGGAPANDAILDIDISTNNMGVLMPRLTSAQRIAFTPSAASMLVYDTSTNTYWYWNGTAWKEFLADDDYDWEKSGNDIFTGHGGLYPSGNVGIGTSSTSAKLDVVGASEFNGTMNLTNDNITSVNSLRINDAGDQEGILWTGTAAKIFVSPLNSGNGDGYLRLINDGGIVFEAGVEDTESMTILSSGNVGIGTAAPSEKLDVVGNVEFSGALMPNGDAGNAGKLLKSNGAGFAPNWVAGISLDDIHTVESTSSLNVSTSWVQIPGETITVNGLNAGDRVLVWFGGNMYMDTFNYNDVDVALFINGVMATIGGYVRVSLDNNAAYIIWENYSAIARYHVPSNGNYTFTVRAYKYYNTGTIYIGGNSSDAAEGVLQVFVLRN